MARLTQEIPSRRLVSAVMGQARFCAIVAFASVISVFSSCTREQPSEPADTAPAESQDLQARLESLAESGAVDVEQLISREGFEDLLYDWRVHYDLGATLRDQGNLAGAVEHLRRAAQLASAPDEIAATKLALGAAHIEAGRSQLGAEAIRSSIRHQPDYFVKGLYWLGRARIAEGNADAAAALLLEYRRRNPFDADAGFWLGRARLARGDASEAHDLFARAAADFPSEAVYHHWVGVAAMQRLDYDGAVHAFLRATELDPANAETHWSLAKVRLLLGDVERAAASAGDLWLLASDLERAEQLLDALHRAAASNLVVRRHFGRIMLARAKYKEAVAALESVTEDAAATATDHAYLGWACLASGRLSEADAAFTAALELDPSHVFASEGVWWLSLMKGTAPTPDWDYFERSADSPIRVKTARHWADRLQNGGKPAADSAAIGKFTGLGAAGFWHAGLRVLVILEGSPAHVLGIRPGDRITHIDGTPLDGERDWDVALGPVPTDRGVLVSWISGEEERIGVTAVIPTAQESPA
jgi:tetratricopeptide (TPR) repeat protein